MTLPDSQATAAQLADLLRWYGEMGVDAVVDEVPHDRFAEAATAVPLPPAARLDAPARATPPVNPARSVVPPVAETSGRPPLRGRAPTPVERVARPMDAAALSVEAAVGSAREAAAGAGSLEALQAAMEAFDGCALKRSASRLVFADGNPAARIMLVGEAPGAEEDRTGRPFVGKGGQLLDRMLASIELDRTSVYIANVVPWRPPGNRTPTPQEVATCLPFVTRQIALVDPAVLLLLGGSALQAFVPAKEGITRARGKWIEIDCNGRSYKALPMLHPAYLLRQPGQKRLAWQDLRLLRKTIGPTAGPAAGSP